MQNYKELIDKAILAREMSYSPYSTYRTGAALLCDDGSIYTGCNIENASYSATVCAERTTVFKAVSEGKRNFTAIAIIGGIDKISGFAHPCGACRQVLSEFCREDFEVVLYDGQSVEVYTLGQLFPHTFNKGSIK